MYLREIIQAILIWTFIMPAAIGANIGWWKTVKGKDFLRNLAEPNSAPATYRAPKLWKVLNGKKILRFSNNNYIKINSAAKYNCTRELTLTAWIYPTSKDSRTMQVVCKRDNKLPVPYCLVIRGNKIIFSLYASNRWQSISYSPGISLAKRWNHIGATFKRGNVCLFFNGALVKTAKFHSSVLPVSKAPVVIGNFDGGNEGFEGCIYEVKIFNNAQSAKFLAEEYAEGLDFLGKASEINLKSKKIEVTLNAANSYSATLNAVSIKDMAGVNVFLEMPKTGVKREGLVHNIGGSVIELQCPAIDNPRLFETGNTIFCEIKQSWPLFNVTKTYIVNKVTDEVILGYRLTANQEFLPDNDWPVKVNFSFPGKAAVKINTNDNYLSIFQGSNALIAARPGDCGNKFNAKEIFVDGNTIIKSTVLTLNSWQKPGRSYYFAWRITASAANNIAGTVKNLLANYRRERSTAASLPTSTLIPEIVKAPALSCRVGDRQWRNASCIGGFETGSGEVAVNKTFAKLLIAEGKLFVRYICYDKDITKLKQDHTLSDSDVWRDDSVELFLAPAEGTTYYHYIINSINARLDEKCDNWGEGEVSMDRKWNSACKSKVKIDKTKNRWIVDIAVPLKEAGIDLARSKEFRLNLARYNRITGSSCWSPTYGPFHNIKRFGKAHVNRRGISLNIKTIGEKSGKYECKLTVFNPTVEKRTFNIKITPYDNLSQNGLTYYEPFTLPPYSRKSFAVPYNNMRPEGKPGKLAVTLRDAKNKIISHREYRLTTVLGKKIRTGLKYISSTVPELTAWVLNTDYKIFPNDKLKSINDNPQPILLQAARGEDESFQIALTATSDSKSEDYKISATALIGEAGTINPEQIRIRRIGYVKTTVTSDPYGFLGDWPDPLLPEQRIVTAPGKNHGAWITVKVPRSAATGLYKGSILVKRDSETILRLPYQLKVRNFTLPRHYTEMYWGPDRRFLQDEYHMTTNYYFSCWSRLKNGKIEVPDFETEKFKNMIRQAKKDKPPYACIDFMVGGGHKAFDFLGTKPGTPEYFRLTREHVTKVNKKFKELGYPGKLAIYIFDEPTPNHLPLIGKMARMIKSIDKNICIWAPIYIDNWRRMPDKDRKLIDRWWTLYPYMTSDFMEWAKKNNKTVMAGFNCGTQYPYPSLFIDHPALSPRVISWVNWKLGISAIANWHTWIAPNSKDPYIDPSNCNNFNGDGLLLYPSGPNKQEPCNVPSIRVELMREGMEDYEYMVILEKLIGKCKDSKLQLKAKEVMEEAAALIQSPTSYSRNPADYRRMRLKMADYIEKLLK